MQQTVLEIIRTRRSVREFTAEPVERGLIEQILSAGIWAPSGLNNQPWRFVIICAEDLRERLAELTKYAHIVRAAPVLIAVYLDQEKMYDRVKDHQAAGACIQNMLLAAHALGLGLSSQHELAAVLALGHPLHNNQQSLWLPLETFILHEFGDNAP